MESERWLERFSETTRRIHEALNAMGRKEAAVQGVLACISANDREQLAADLHAISVYFAPLLHREAHYITTIAFDIASIALSFDEKMQEHVDSYCAAIDEERITSAWRESVWRRGEPPAV